MLISLGVLGAFPLSGDAPCRSFLDDPGRERDHVRELAELLEQGL